MFVLESFGRPGHSSDDALRPRSPWPPPCQPREAVTMNKITPRSVSGPAPGTEASPPKPPDSAALLAQKLLAVRREARLSTPAASGPLRILCVEIDNLKQRLS